MGIKERVDRVYSSNNNQELTKNYDIWADEYEQDLIGDSDYLSPEKVADFVLKYVSKSCKILDAGSGTGLAGKVLYDYDYTNLVAIDISEGMLNKARQKNIYTELYKQVLGETLDFPTNFFDAVICVGVFTYNHAPSSAFDELIRITKPEGYIIFTLRPDFYEINQYFQTKMTALESSSQWQFLERGEKYYSHPNTNSDTILEVWTYQVISLMDNG
ncbi:MAG: class I SAM-dependent methyltransferase [Okeania sp. SIO3I5]|uniref:class I SAM-dependent DNA methyltransferase n=1 Tax=Okeania sp. SIO3I5 TaxID=2607805 RepID=UPI0013B974EE|nr:class I SAM-dependent methyltransferase [Okeania sp. SIO3I5]NEQ39667.1 class I SAM-dependent methyltransferase [Okeania sp. SIO3I5]